MILHDGLSKAFWEEAVCNAAYVRNRVITTATAVTPYERWYGKKPDVSNLRVFGCTAYAHVPDASRQKLDQKAVKMRFVGYSLTQKGYRLYDENRQRIFIRRDITFNKTDFGSTKVQIKCDEGITECAEEEMELKGKDVITVDEQQDLPTDPRRSGRERNPPMYYHDEYATITTAKYAALYVAEIEKYATQWKAAADAEYQSFLENETWELVELPARRKSLSCKWAFKVRHDETGKVERFNGRLVAKGFL
jgi:hypothetical protein